MATNSDLPTFAWRPVAVMTAALGVVLTAFSGRYGFHRDELYFVAAGDRPAWGYIDQPPLTPMLARLSTEIFGITPAGLRVVATLIGMATVVVAALVARELGGGRGAQVFAAAATALSGYVLVVTHMLSTASGDLLIWTVIGLLTLRLLRTGDGRWWLAIGAAVGVGLANKWLVLLLLSALGIAVLLVGPRSVLRTWWLAAGVGLALLIAAPTLVWQARNDFPLLTVASGISEDDGMENRLLFVPMQLVMLSVVLVPVWIAGLVRLWRDPALRWARALAVSYPVLCVEVVVLGGKPYYSVPLLVLLTAAGAEPTLAWLSRGARVARRVWTVVLAGVSIVFLAIVSLPVLPVDSLNSVLVLNKEAGETAGWPDFAATVARAWQQVPADQRATAVLLTRNYGQAAAIERHGPEHGLPRPYSGHMSYADWGPPPDTMTGPVVTVGRFGGRPQERAAVTGCRVIAVHDNGFGLDNDEQGTEIGLCTGPSVPWSRIWSDLRHYY